MTQSCSQKANDSKVDLRNSQSLLDFPAAWTKQKPYVANMMLVKNNPLDNRQLDIPGGRTRPTPHWVHSNRHSPASKDLSPMCDVQLAKYTAAQAENPESYSRPARLLDLEVRREPGRSQEVRHCKRREGCTHVVSTKRQRQVTSRCRSPLCPLQWGLPIRIERGTCARSHISRTS